MNVVKLRIRMCAWHTCQAPCARGSMLCAAHQKREDATPASTGYRGQLFIISEEEAEGV